ncbi:hypothetical protein E2I00_004045, partial [Balaenoptera physalus]
VGSYKLGSGPADPYMGMGKVYDMSWRPQYRSSKFRNVYGKVANREHCFDGIPITKNVHDNHFCAVNARFLAIVTESAGGGSFLVIPLEQIGISLKTVSCIIQHKHRKDFGRILESRSAPVPLLLAHSATRSPQEVAMGPLGKLSVPGIGSLKESLISSAGVCNRTLPRTKDKDLFDQNQRRIVFNQNCGDHLPPGVPKTKTKQKTMTGRIEPNYPKVCGHQGNVLDIKWNPFIDNIIASCSEDTSVKALSQPKKIPESSSIKGRAHTETVTRGQRTDRPEDEHKVMEPRTAAALTPQERRCSSPKNLGAPATMQAYVRIWEIPEGGLKRNMTEALLELHGHSRRVGLVEWHPTTNNILFSAGYDYKVLIWNLDVGEPVKMIDCHSDVILCMSFNTDGSLLTTTCKDKKLRVIEPRSGRVLQEANCKNHRVNRVVFLGNTKRLLTTGVSRWNTRQIALWDQVSRREAGAGGATSKRCYSGGFAGIGEGEEDLSMPLIEEEIDGLSGLLFPFYDADTHMLYLAGKGDGNIRYYEISTEKPYLSYLMEFRSPAPQKGLGVMPKHGLDVSACEVFRFYKLVTLKGLIEPISMIVPRRPTVRRDPVLMSLKEGYKKSPKMVFKAPIKEKKSVVVNGIDLLENVPPRTENELLRMFFRQQDEIRRLKEELAQKDIRIRQLQLELKNLRNSPKNC